MQIVFRGRDHGDLVVELRTAPGAGPASSPRLVLVVPDEIEVLHPLLTPLIGRGATLGISTTQVPRALRLLHVLFSAAEAAGCTVGWADQTDGGVAFRRDGWLVVAHLVEETEERDVLPDPDSTEGVKRYSWQRIQPERQSVPSGRLRLQLDEDWSISFRRRSWADRQRWRLEDKLGAAWDDIDTRLTAMVDRQRAQERAAEQKQREWEAAMAAARDAFDHARRVTALEEQLEAWERAARIRAYCADLDDVAADEHTEQRQAWIAWALGYAEQLDPRSRADLSPATDEPKPEDLRPYLRRWSPYGPDQR
ncbi:hypothetical protein [Pseudonocardia sp. TRM90224]|uniref:hypothetical protein n=1 Tax=Pseudonocardia sp. TRM90224 TaxID=2812678 RepID=UPI001E4208DA|nr:hypothetical protein [Pseudonocardia sp. TRM90224]